MAEGRTSYCRDYDDGAELSPSLETAEANEAGVDEEGSCEERSERSPERGVDEMPPLRFAAVRSSPRPMRRSCNTSSSSWRRTGVEDGPEGGGATPGTLGEERGGPARSTETATLRRDVSPGLDGFVISIVQASGRRLCDERSSASSSALPGLVRPHWEASV